MEEIVDELGLEPERLRLEWISASEGEKFANSIKEVTENVRKLGPSPLRPEGVL